MPGIRSRLGDFATKAIRLAQKTGRTVGEFLHIIKPIAPDIEPMIAAREYGRVSTFDALTPDVLKLRGDEYVPRDLFVPREIPWGGRYAYEVSIYGRSLKTGRFARWKYNMQSNRELTIDEIQDQANVNIGRKGTSPQLAFIDLKVTGAWKSDEIEW